MSGNIPEKKKRLVYFWITGTLFLFVVMIVFAWHFSKENVELLSAKERAWLAAHPVICFAPDPCFPPVEYFGRDGVYKGITADYLNLLEKKLGIRFKIVRLKDWDEIISQARNREIDMFAASQTPQRSEYLLFSTPYIELPAAIIAREKVKDPLTMEKLKGMKVSVVSGYATNDFIKNNYPELNIDVVPDVRTGLRKVSFGLSDAFVENLATATYYIEKEGITNLRIAGESGYIYRMAFASRKDWPELNRILEKGLAGISDGEKKAIYKKWIPVEHSSYLASKEFHLAVLSAFGLAVLVILSIIIWNRSLTKEVGRRTEDLEKELAERKRAEDALRETEEKFRVLAETSPSGICLYQGERIIYANPATTRLFGYSEQECLKMRFWDWVHDDSKEVVRQRGMARQRGESVPPCYECRHVGKDGREIWIFVSAGRIEYGGRPAGIVTFFDISDRKCMEEELQHARDELEKRVEERTAELADTVGELLLSRFCIDKAAIGIFQTTFEGRILGVNEFACRSLGYTSDELCAMKITDIDPAITDEKLLEIKRMLDASGSVTHETVHRRKDGSVFPVEITANYVEFQGKSYTVSFVKDISVRKSVEEQLREQKKQLEIMNITLERRVEEEVAKNREKDIMLIQQNRQAALGEMLDHIAHQWKQPINTISLIVQDIGESFLQDELSKEYVYETVEKILDIIEHMAQTIEIFRDFYKVEKEKTVFRIKESIDKALIFIEPALRFHAIAVELEADPELSAIGYPKEFAQVLLNILVNARDACMESGTVKPRVKINAFAEENSAVVTITDNAGGIPDDIIGKVFDLYFTTKGASGGTGIGLHMSKNIIEKNMGGSLSAANVRDGAQFRIELNIPGC
jgi:PAS domain S-box-containing protein